MGIYKLRTEFGTHLRVLLWVILVIFVVGALWMFRPPSSVNGNSKDAKKIIIKVENTEIKRHVFDIEWENVYNMLSGRNIRSPFDFARIKGMIISQIIDSQKTILIAEKKGIKISKKDIKNAIDEKVVEALKANRQIVLGQISPEDEKVDPRKDKKYISTLTANGLSIDSVISNAKASVSEFSIKAELARKALVNQAVGNVGSITDAEINKSYDSYNIDIILVDDQKTTESKAMEIANKVAKDAKGGADFAKLKKENSVIDMPAMDFNFIDMPYFPASVIEQVEKLSVGGVTDAIKTDGGIYVIKLLKINNKKPAKLDDKAKKERSEKIKSSREQIAERALTDELGKITDVSVLDAELAGYYYSSLAENEMANPEKAKANYTKAKAEFEKALKKKEIAAGDDIAKAQLAYVNYQLGDYEAASEQLYKMLDDPEAQTTESFDLRKLAGDCYMKLKKNDEAVKQFESASELNRSDANAHEELAGRFKELGRDDLAAKELALAKEIKDYEAKKAGPMNVPVPAK